MPEISSTLPTIIMQDESVLNNSVANSDLALPSESYSLIGEDIIKHSFSDDDDDDDDDEDEDDEDSSSDEQSDVEIDL